MGQPQAHRVLQDQEWAQGRLWRLLDQEVDLKREEVGHLLGHLLLLRKVLVEVEVVQVL